MSANMNLELEDILHEIKLQRAEIASIGLILKLALQAIDSYDKEIINDFRFLINFNIRRLDSDEFHNEFIKSFLEKFYEYKY